MLGSTFWSTFLLAFCAGKTPGGRYGEWGTSPVGSPFYRYTMDHIADKAPPTSAGGAGWSGLPASSDQSVRGSREHTFQLGNDRLVLVANNYGAVRVRSDEGSPKYYTAAETGVDGATQLGGGFGYLFGGKGSVVAGDKGSNLTTTHQHIATTYYTGGGSDRDFGVGWVSTSGTSGTSGTASPASASTSAPASSGASAAVVVNHTVATPFGDDAVVLIEVTIENRGDASAEWTWSEVWVRDNARRTDHAHVHVNVLEGTAGVLWEGSKIPQSASGNNLTPVLTCALMLTRSLPGLVDGALRPFVGATSNNIRHKLHESALQRNVVPLQCQQQQQRRQWSCARPNVAGVDRRGASTLQ